MTFMEFLAAKQLLYEEHLGVLLRATDNAKSAEYKRSTDLLKRQK